jgi:hypothetical protein
MYHMELRTAMLADHAVVAPDGKLYINGGGVETIGAPAFPTTHPTLSVVLVVEIDYNEALDPHRINVALMRDGVALGPGAVGQLTVGHPPNLRRGASVQVPLAMTFPMLQFPSPGRYEWAVAVDDEPLGSIAVELVQQLNPLALQQRPA